jgi:formylglycine-generating enzyme required for sulfatase activity
MFSVAVLLGCLGADDAALSNSLGMKLVPVKSGKFLMGQGARPPRSRTEWLERDEDESPAHEVRITRAFHMSAHEVTNAQYEKFDPGHKKWRGKHGASADDDGPVTFVTWDEAVAFCAWLTKKEGKPYRLPTEAEWEYACRAGSTTLFSTGDTLPAESANVGSGKVRPVGSYRPNAWGLHDLHGNVAEWCQDWHGPYDAGPQSDPVGRATGHARVTRGWSFLKTGAQEARRFARSANRSGHLPDDANAYTGFRVVMGPQPDSKPLPAVKLEVEKEVKQGEAPRKGPAPEGKPWLVDYGKNGPALPADAWGPIFASHNHYSAAVACPNGDVLAVWYTCVGERDRQLAQAASRLRAGAKAWDPPSLFFSVPDVNCHAPVLLRDGQRIYHFCTQSLNGWDHASNIMRYSEDSGATWSQPRVILPRHAANALSQPCSAFVAKDGAIVLACDGDLHRDERLMISRDQGKSWDVARGCLREAVGKYAIHPAIVERKDGAALAFLRGPRPMPLAVSKDRGASWAISESPFSGIHSGQKSAVLRLSSGAILHLTYDNDKALGGGAMVALSLDEGKTWPHARKVEAPVGGYMSLAQGEDGVIHLIGSRLKFAACNEAWIREGKPWPVRP